MAFDETKAQLSARQLEVAKALDTVYEEGEVALQDGFQFQDLMAVPGLSDEVLAVVRAVGGAKTKEEMVNLLLGVAAAFHNDNLPLAPEEPEEPTDG